MDELESRINSVLGDPQQLEQISKLAQSIMAGAGSGESTESAQQDMPDAAMIKRIMRLMSADGEKDRGERSILEAMSPYLSEKRRGKMDKALKIAKLMRLAKLAMEESEGDA